MTHRPTAAAWLLLLCGWLLAVTAPALGAADCYALVVSGDPGPALAGPASSLGSWSANFDRWRAAWQGLLVGPCHIPAGQVRVLPAAAAGRGATRAQVLDALAQLVAHSTASDQVVVVLIGHAYESCLSAHLCLAGCDLTDTDLALALRDLRCRELVLLALAPDCRALARSLAGPGRVIILGNVKSSAPYFGEFLLRSLAPGGVPLLQAFNQASLDTIHWYQNQQWLPERKVWLVDGAVNQEVWKLMYPRGACVAGDAQPHAFVDSTAPDAPAAIAGRRLTSEVAGLEDNGDGEVSTIYDGGSVANLLAGAPGSDGALSATITLGTP